MHLANRESLTAATQWLSGKRWHLAVADDERMVLAMQQKLGLPEVLCRLLVHRQVPIKEAEDYLNPGLRQFMPDPFHLLDMDKAVHRLVKAVQAGEAIGIFGDYDVDGATSSALLMHYLRWLGVPAMVHIPDRQKEGYGPNMFGLRRLQAQGVKLIVTVDTGTLAHDALAEAAAEKMEIIVVDHHQGEPQLPEALAVVNPNRFDETSPHSHLAAVGVTFLLLVALQQKLREAGYFAHKAMPDLRWLLDIVALGTVCDVVPLRGVNRAFVVQGLRILRQRQNPGLAALMDVAGLAEPAECYHLGFLLGPRINAGGRVGAAGLGVRLLTASHYEEAAALAQELDQYNRERKAIEAQVQEQAIAQAMRQANQPMLFVGAEGWHEGIIGIIAGRLKEQFNRPAAVISWNAEGKGKASARSVPGVDLGRVIIAAKQRGLLSAGGGHSMAAGFSLNTSRYEAFQEFMIEQIGQDVSRYQEEYSAEVDAVLPPSAITPELVAVLEQAGPFGAGNPSPHFLLPKVRIVQADIVGNGHLRCLLVDADIAGRSQSTRLKAMGFGMAESVLGQALLHHQGRNLQMVGKVKREFWQGKESVSFLIEDAAFL